MGTAPVTVAERVPPVGRLARRYGWVSSVVVLFAVLLGWKAALSPGFGSFELQTLFAATLALAYLAVAQSIVIVSGGIDLSVGAMMVLINVLAARFMEGQPFGTVLLVAAGCLGVAVLLGALTGLVISLSGIPDIVVTLATNFIWAGAALLVLPTPGGGTAPQFQALVLGTAAQFWPALLCLAVPIALVWVPLRRSRTGLAVWAMGSSRDAAYLSGVRILRTRVLAYAVGGLFCGLAGLAVTAFTAGGDPRATAALTATLTSVAAAVLGGLVIGGGVGGVVGPVLAVWCLDLIPSIMLSLGVNPSYGEAIKGVVIVLVVLVGGLIRVKWRSR